MCAECGTACNRIPGFPNFSAERADEVAPHLLARDFNFILSLGQLQHDDDPQVNLELFRCSACGQTNTLAATRLSLVINQQGQQVLNKQPLMKPMLVSQQEADYITQIVVRVVEESLANANKSSQSPQLDSGNDRLGPT